MSVHYCTNIRSVSSYICTVQTLDNTEGAIKNGQSRELGIGYTRRRKTKQNLEDTTMGKPLAQALYLTRQHYRRTVPSGVNNNRIIHVLSFGFDRTWWRLFQRTWWMLFQKRVVRTKLDIYVFIVFILSINSPIHQLIADNILISFGNINFKTVAISRIWYAYTPDVSEFTSGCCPSLALLLYFVFIRLLSPPPGQLPLRSLLNWVIQHPSLYLAPSPRQQSGCVSQSKG